MSWLSDLTSKAEAMLVKLDQDAAQALQKPDGLLRGTKIIDQALNTISTYGSDEKKEEEIDFLDDNDQHRGQLSKEVDASFVEINTNLDNNDKQDVIKNNNLNDQSQQKQNEVSFEDKSRNINNDNIQNNNATNSDSIILETLNSTNVPMTISDNNQINPSTTTEQSQINSLLNKQSTAHTTPSRSDRFSRKFVIQTTKSGSKAFNSTRHNNKQSLYNGNKYNQYRDEINDSYDPTSELESVEDIRASIRRTLQEYANESPYENNNTNKSSTSNINNNDNQQILIHNDNKKLSKTSIKNKSTATSRQQSTSFTIELPDSNNTFNDQSNTTPSSSSSSDIALRLLQQTALKKKSTFNIHKVLNKIANPNGQSKINNIITGDMKIRMRRIKMRAGSYARRLNYYYRTNPMMTYIFIGYLVLLQILVIYVLFFYQSSPSGNLNDLSSQINEQEEKLHREKSENF